MKKAIILGGGLAGLTLATELVENNFEVIILEKNKYLGGRASNTIDTKTGDPVPIGPHIFVKGYDYFKKFLEKIGAKEDILWERSLFLDLVYLGHHYQFKMTDIPTSFKTFPKILNYPYINLWDKISNTKLMLKIYFGSKQQFEKLDGINAYDYLIQQGVSKNAINKMWRFFVLSMLNVPIELCSAAELCLLAKYWITTNHREIGFAKVGLGDLYTSKAEKYIKKHGGEIKTGVKVKKIVFQNNCIKYLNVEKNGKTEKIYADVYICALNPIQLRELLPEDARLTEHFRKLNAFEGVPYISVNLWFDKKISTLKFWALLNDSKTPQYLNLDFYDESNIYSTKKDHSYIASNIIYSKPYESLSDNEIVEKTLAEIKTIFPHHTAELTHSKINRTPYVIYAPYPGMRKNKLPNKTPYDNFYLCGDWTNKEMTQSMEAAVQSGYQCYEAITKDINERSTNN